MYDPQKRVSEKNILSNRVSIEGTIVNFGDTSYNLSQTQDGVRLGEYLKHIGYRLDVDSLNANLNDSANPIIVRTKEKFLEDSNIQEIRLPVGITFTRDDFMHKNSNGSVGSTLLGHYFRNGIIGTNVEKYAVTYLHIDNVRLVDDNVNTQESSITQTVENAQQQKQESDRKAMLDLFSGLGSGGSLDMRG